MNSDSFEKGNCTNHNGDDDNHTASEKILSAVE